ncbi:nonribosomal peptide synthetase 2 [Alternaria burnsii]|uniref:Nonribosomal peptide synthetase 2 n=1 Tax=Alternaria burnsii TaxID=1187904 RepID=A0A8H7EJ70_9PLEO|nr:nonribosomal peptide synthetase 2 [Alternaria burnsii]KAF7682086.1 nonribosomal peptide synthetase 2 [Alternaria burnsii]
MIQENGANQRLSILNERPSILSGPDLLHELVRPFDHDATAIDFLEHGSKRRKFSYRNLHLLSDVLAGRITERLSKLESVSPIIPVFLPQSPELYIVLLAVLKAGKAFCPLNLDTPIERLKFILDDISPDLFITFSTLDERIRTAVNVEVVLVDKDLCDREDRLGIELPRSSPRDLAYVLYTSGSTGKPKAVSVSHHAVTQSLLAHDRHIPDFARFLQFAAPTFDVSIFEIFFPWFRGKTLVGSTRAQMLDDLPGTINSLEIDAAELTPTVVSSLLQGRASVPGLKLLLTIGEMLTQHVIVEYGGDETKKSILWAMYGPTEASIHCTLQPQFSTCSPTSTIGRPLDTVSAFIIAPPTGDLTSVGVEILRTGEVGELAVGGPQVAEEYLNRPDLTSASFIEHQEYGRLYRTGDRARINDNGILECLGRVVAGQVKLRGQRVELGEIEQAIMRIPNCRTATVMIVQESLVAFCAADWREITRTDVLNICSHWLPAFMVPSDVFFIDAMPQLPSGKVDRDSLTKEFLSKASSNGMASSTNINLGDHVGWSVLNIIRHHISPDLGSNLDLAFARIDSLQSIRIASALRREGFELGAMDVLSAQTLEDVIAICRKPTTAASLHGPTKDVPRSLINIETPQLERWRSNIAYVLPCTSLQEAMLAETMARPAAYCNWVEVELSISQTFEDIRDAIKYLASKIEIIRTGFLAQSQHSGTFSQIIWKELLASQIEEVDSFSKLYTLQSEEDFLRPFHTQIITSSERPRLLFRMHHALYDGWSFDLLLHDLDMRLRREKLASRPQFREVAQYLSQRNSEDEQSSRNYWTSLLSGYLPISLPNYHGKVVGDRVTRRFTRLSAIDRSRLFECAREMAINPQVYFQAATAYVLSLYNGTADVTLGNVSSGRTIPVAGVEDIIGPCIATVPFRIDLNNAHSTHDLLHLTQTLNRESLKHSTIPLRDIVRAGNVPPGTQLFDVLFVWQQSIASDSNSTLAARVIDSADDLEFRLTLEFEPREGDISLRATYDASTFPEQQIECLSRQIDEVVGIMLESTNHNIDKMKWCFTTPSLSIANPTPRQQPIESGPAYAVEQWALSNPGRPAVKFARVIRGDLEVEKVATYGMLNSCANQFARVLADRGVGNDQLVCVMMEKSVNLYICILAVLKLGCGYLPLVPDTPIERVKTILNDARVKVCVSDLSTSPNIRKNLRVELVDFNATQLSDYSDQNLNVPYNGQHLAYAVFTSGSTGTPKGVLVTQDNLMSNLQYLSTIYPFSAESCLLQSCSQAFDVSVFEIFFSWYVGMCLCTAKKDDLFRDFEAAINYLGVTHLSLTPTVAALVDPENVPKVEFLVTAGEALTEHVRRRWAGKGLYQGYGPSETTNICTVRAAVTPDDLINNIGMPFTNTSAFVLDPESEAVLPRGAVGELCFGGYQVFRGYLNRPELNATKIINHPTYGRLYRSGDMGILLPDESILSRGRSDDQVKIRGQRVELGEITSVMLDHRSVQDCVTLLLPRPNNAQTLVIFWVPATAASDHFQRLEPAKFELVKSDLFDLLSQRLPPYMVPSYLIPISCLPMTMQAKIDKGLLQNLFWDLAENQLEVTMQSTDSDQGPEMLSPWEKGVVQALAWTLDISPKELRRTSSFFNVGLDSVSAIRFCNRLRTLDLGDFAISTVLKNSSVARLASAHDLRSHSPIQETTKPPTTNVKNFLKSDEVSRILSRFEGSKFKVARILPCTPLQEAMLSSGQSFADSAYCNTMIFDVKGDIFRLQNCWSSMVERHEILRTCFVGTEDPSFVFAQVVLRDTGLNWQSHDFTDELPSYTHSIISDLLRAEKPPVYFALARDGPSTKLLFSCHHALYDGIAISTLLEEIQDLYLDFKLPPPVSYDVYLQQMLHQNYAEGDAYWAALLEGLEPTLFPTLTSNSSRVLGRPATSSRHLQLPLDNIRGTCQNMSVSLLAIVQAAWAKLLHFYTGESDICFGNVVSGRSIAGDGVERIVAPCFNTLPFRVNFDFQRSNDALMRLTHTLSIESLAHQLTPLRRIQNRVLHDSGRLFDTLVILQQPKSSLDSSIWTLEQDLGDMDLPVVCEIIQNQTANTMELVLHYQTSLLSTTEALLVMETYEACLSSLMVSPNATAVDMTKLPTHLRAESNINYERFETGAALLHSGFELMAASYPERVALDFLLPNGEKTIWSFKALNENANSIAHKLIEANLGPDDIVPVHIQKSPQFYASILGVLKAGAAFAPVHPSLPEARRKVMLQELKPKLVLCSDNSMLSKNLTEAIVVNVQAVPPTPNSNPVISSLNDSNLAYCLFTSGSTGVPKAVSMEHRAPIQTILSSKSRIPWSSSSRLLQYAAVTFDMCYYDCFLAWTFGFTLCTAGQDDLLNDLPKVINSLQADLLDLTPSVAVSIRRVDIPSVKWLFCIGESMSPAIVKEWGSACVNSYGPTEAAFCTTISPISSDGKTSIIGKPFETTSFAVFSSQGDSPLPMLSTGELYIGGAQLARGYFGKPDLTSERFVTRYGQRYYKSGDMVRMLSDGNFEFVGRTDDQVKIRGLRVELGEINHVIQDTLPDIAFVTTQILKKEQTGKDQLVSFLVSHDKIEKTKLAELQREVKKAASSRLPSYMVPQFFLFVDDIPRSMAGKVDKKALIDVFRDHADVDTLTNGCRYESGHQWSRTAAEVRDTFARLSNTSRDDISLRTSIYQLGLDSISAVQVAAALRKQGHPVNATDVLKHTTCTGLAEFIDQASPSDVSTYSDFDFGAFERKYRAQVLSDNNIPDSDVLAIRPCTPIQNGMVSQFLTKEGAVYMNSLRLQLELNVDIDRLKRAWTMVMERHSILRTGFAHVKAPIHPFAMIEYTCESLDLPWTVTSENTSDSIDQWVKQIQHVALRQLQSPPWALRIVESKDHYALDLAILHALFDAQSLQLILDEVTAAYLDQSLPLPKSIETTIGSIIQFSGAKSPSREKFWTDLGKTANTCRFPNLAPLRYGTSSPLVYTRKSAKPLHVLEDGCRHAEITIQTAGVASWLSLLSAYTGESSATCGVVLSGRIFEGAEDSVFPCINTVPVACAVTNDKVAFLERIMELNAQIQQHQFTPLKEIQTLMGFPNEALFDSIFAYQKLPGRTEASSIWKVADERATIEYPVSIELEPVDGYLEYRLTFLPHVIPEEQANLILEQLDHLMENYTTISPITETSHTEQLYSITPAQEPELPSNARLLHELVEHTAMEYPKRIAFEFVTANDKGERTVEQWTYAELDAEGNRIAHLLVSHGVQSGSLVGVCFDKCPEASFAMLGVLKAGCGFVAIDPGAPSARQTYIIEDSRAQAVMSLSFQAAKFEGTVSVPVLKLDEIDWRTLSGSALSRNDDINAQDRTTGTPKGCELTHENAVQALLAFQRLFAGHWDTNSRWLQFASFHFDVSVLEQYWSWSVGICVVSAPRDLIFEDLAKSISDLNITHIDLTPSLAQILHPDEVPSLCKGVFITGGESLKQEILDVWGPKGVIYNGYGPTEATIGCTMYPRVPANGKPSNIGPQFDNVGSLVLHSGSDTPVLRGGVGELCVSGKLVGKGYLNRPELTAERFPYLEHFGERVYRTGDLVRLLHDGTFDFLGRADDQIKLRGQRLEVAEINSVIKQSSQTISDVATLVLKHPKQQKEQLVAFLVCDKFSRAQIQVRLDEAEWMASAKQACYERLPPYMVPTHFVPLTTMPLNINNKADGKKLRELYEALSSHELQALSATTSDRDETWSKHDEKLRHALSKTLAVSEESIGKDTSFFELGMDSISVIEVSHRLKQAGFATASASSVMRCPTIRRLAKILDTGGSVDRNNGSFLAVQQAIHAVRHRYRHSVAQSLSIESSRIDVVAPSTPLQQGMIARSLESNNGLYFNTFHFKLHDSVNEQQLQAAWESVHASTPILRTAFANTEEGHVQAVLRGVPLSGVTQTLAKDHQLTEHAERLRYNWLELNRTQLRHLFEVHLIATPTQKLLLVHIFHALYDGNSIGLIFQAVWDSYNGKDASSVAPAFHDALAHGPLNVTNGAKKFWQNHVTKESSPLPTISSEPAKTTVVVTRKLHAFSGFDSVRRQLNVTAQAVAQACWLFVLQEHVKSPVTTGVIVSGRSIDLEGADRIIGPMFNTIPYQHCHERGESWKSIIKRVHDFNVEAHIYQHTALRDIVKWCKRTPNQPLFDNLFAYQVAQGDEEWARNDVWEILDGDAVADYPLALEIEQKTSGMFKLTLVTQGHVADETLADELLDRFEAAFRQILQDPSCIPESNAEVNGIAKNGTILETEAIRDIDDTTHFEWTSEAVKIKEEIANLSGLDLDGINGSTSIFELGLDSIDAIKLSSKLKKRGVNIPVSGIMRGLTISKMVQHISARETPDRESSQWDLDPFKQSMKRYLEEHSFDTAGIQEALPLTPLQEAMVAEMIVSGYTRYYNHDVLKLRPGVDIGKLRDAWSEVIAASPILRTGFVEVDDPEIDGSFAQIVHRRCHNFWSHLKLESTPDFTSIFDELRHDIVQNSLSTPAFRLSFINTPDQSYLVLSIGHALYDGWSLSLLHADVHRAYKDRFSPRPDYERSLADIIATSRSASASFWQDYLSDAEQSLFSRRSDASSELGSHVHRHEQNSVVRVDKLQAFARSSNVSLQTIGQSVFALVSAFYTQSLDITFGSVLSGRDDSDRSQLMFPTMNTVAIRVILHGSGTDMLRYVQDNFTNIKQWQHYPLRKALSAAGVDGRLFESLFIFQKSSDTGQEQDEEEKLYSSIEGHSDIEYPVCIEMEVVNEVLVWRCAVKEEVLDREASKELLNRMDDVLRYLIDQSKAPVIEITAKGASVCGLPAFTKKSSRTIGNSQANGVNNARDLPSTETAIKIRETLASISKTSEDEITSDMTIFHVGLDSISAIKVSSLLRKQGIVLSVGDMLRAGTIQNMARLLDERTVQTVENNADPHEIIQEIIEGLDRAGILNRAGVDDAGVTDILPVTAGQLYMLSMWLNTKGSNFYADFTYEIHGVMDFGDLENSWQALIETTPVLRTFFASSSDERMPYVAIVSKDTRASITNVTGDEHDNLGRQLLSITTRQPWVHLFASQTASGWALKLKIQHALYDGVSLPLMMQQFQSICNGATPPLPDNTLARVAASGRTASAKMEKKTFWAGYLASLSQSHLIQPSRSPEMRTEIFVPALLSTSNLEATARRHGVSAQSIFLAAYAKIYAVISSSRNDEDVVIGVYLANRSLPINGIASAVVPTVNLLPLRVKTPLGRKLTELAGEVQHDLQDISNPSNASASLFEIKEWTGVQVDTFVNFLSLPDTQVAEGDTHDRKGITIKPAQHWQESVSRVSKIEDCSFEIPAGLVNERVNGAYLHAVDVEATIRNGALDVGIFAPTDMTSLRDGEELVRDLRRQLEEL